MNPIPEMAARLLGAGQGFVLATIISRHGSAPRTAGTRMIIAQDGRPMGTIGGGLFEAQVIQKAAEVLAARHPMVLSFDMTHAEAAATDMICGGRVEVLLEVIDPESPAAAVVNCWRAVQSAPEPHFFLTILCFTGETLASSDHCLIGNRRVVCGNPPPTVMNFIQDPRDGGALQTTSLGEYLVISEPVAPPQTVFLFGAGHVAQPTARLAALVGFRVWVTDDRAEFANAERFPAAQEIRVAADFDTAFDGLSIDPGAYIVIVTRGHLHDQTVLRQALRTPAAYIGMIGSRRKRDKIYGALRRQGVTEADLKRVHSPIGLDIGAETPAEIGLSIVAELVRVRARKRGS
ncbi:MAG: XdhC family aldehyde oxidoreductase maturation factor [Desulfobacterales bacterium]